MTCYVVLNIVTFVSRRLLRYYVTLYHWFYHRVTMRHVVQQIYRTMVCDTDVCTLCKLRCATTLLCYTMSQCLVLLRYYVMPCHNVFCCYVITLCHSTTCYHVLAGVGSGARAIILRAPKIHLEERELRKTRLDKNQLAMRMWAVRDTQAITYRASFTVKHPSLPIPLLDRLGGTTHRGAKDGMPPRGGPRSIYFSGGNVSSTPPSR